MGKDEQVEEREVLESIFPDEITDISANEFRVSIVLDDPRESEKDSRPAVILLHVSYPEAYPDEAPRLDVESPPNAPRHPQLDIQEDKARLLESLQSTIEENLGMAMVFSLVTTLKENAEQLMTERRQAVDAQQDRERAKAEEEENRKFEGTKVSAQTFAAWRSRFRKELEDEARRKEQEREEELKRKKGAREERKMTGRELWEKGLVSKVAEDEDEDGDNPIEGIKTIEIR